MADTYQGACFCGAVAVEVTGAPRAMGYCHCTSCRSWSAAPVNAFTAWPAASVTVTRGAEHIGTYSKAGVSHRQFCKLCGGHVMSAVPAFGFVGVFAATIPDLPFKPQLHVNYAETVLRIADGLPKFKDFPEAFGGSGEMLAE
jgi:hypothetical protein